MNSTKNTARLAGLLWFLSAVTGGLGLSYVRSNVIVVGDPSITSMARQPVKAWDYPFPNVRCSSRFGRSKALNTGGVEWISLHL